MAFLDVSASAKKRLELSSVAHIEETAIYFFCVRLGAIALFALIRETAKVDFRHKAYKVVRTIRYADGENDAGGMKAVQGDILFSISNVSSRRL